MSDASEFYVDERAVRIFEEAEAFVENDHFVYRAQTHGEIFVNKDAIYPHADMLARLTLVMANRVEWLLQNSVVLGDNWPTVIVAPELGAVMLGNRAAEAFSKKAGREVLSIVAEKDGSSHGGWIVKRGQEKYMDDAEILIIEDIVNEGGTVSRLSSYLENNFNAKVLGVHALFNRKPATTTAKSVGVPYLGALIEKPVEDWDVSECPHCFPEDPSDARPINLAIAKHGKWLVEKFGQPPYDNKEEIIAAVAEYKYRQVSVQL